MGRRDFNNPVLFLGTGVFILILALVAGVSIGSSGTYFMGGLFNDQTSWLFNIRAPRVILAFIMGSILAISGASLQGLLRNPLVSPYTIGVSSGASLGAVIAIKFGLESFIGGVFGLFPVAVVSGLSAMALLFVMGVRRNSWSGVTLLLAGITISFFCSAMIMFIQYTASYQESFKMVRWLMGTMDFITWNEVYLILPFTLPTAVFLLMTGSSINMFSLGEETARSSGVNSRKLTYLIFIFISLSIAASVSIAGPIAFVGIIIPHMIRLWGINDYRIILPASFIYGGAFLVISDTISRIILAPVQVPVGVITSIAGGPFFLFLLIRFKSFGTSDF